MRSWSDERALDATANLPIAFAPANALPGLQPDEDAQCVALARLTQRVGDPTNGNT